MSPLVVGHIFKPPPSTPQPGRCGRDRGWSQDRVGLGFAEFGRLRRVLVHAPGNEIDGITPATFRRCLFEDAIDPEEFRSQHERLVEVLRGEGVAVERMETALRGSRLARGIAASPNLVYTRDTVAVTRAGAIEMRMKSPVRRQEPRLASAALVRLRVPRFTAVQPPATMEGGDLMFLDEATLLVGVGNRTTMSAIRQLRERGQAHGLETVVAVRLPKWVIHLDGTMMIVDRDLALVHREALRLAAVRFGRRGPARRVDVLDFLKQRGIRVIEVTAYERRRRATNVITLGPRKVVCYAGNTRVRRLLVAEGADVIEIEGSELLRGGGGPRCMTAPIERDAAARDSRGVEGREDS